MPYTGPEPARRPLSSDDITDGIVSTADLADSAVTAAKVSSDVSQLGKNLLINGENSVNQRGTQTGLGASGSYLNDRWKYEGSGSGETGRFTASKGTGITGAAGSQRIEVTTADAVLAAGHIYLVTQKIEAQNLQHLFYGTASAKSLTYQATFKSNHAGDFTLKFLAPDGSRTYVTTVTLVGDESQETFTFTLTGDASGTINNDTGVGLEVMLTLAAGSNFQGGTTGAWTAEANNTYGALNSNNFFDTVGNYIEFSLVQLEVGSVATDFEHEDYGTTFAKCLRYFERIQGDGVSIQRWSAGGVRNTTQADAWARYSHKRAVPTVTHSSATSVTFIAKASGNQSTSIATDQITQTSTRTVVTVSGGGLTAGDGAVFYFTLVGDYIDVSAEL